jgi:hypothetical protein
MGGGRWRESWGSDVDIRTAARELIAGLPDGRRESPTDR